MNNRLLLITTALLASGSSSVSADQTPRQFLKTYCIRCHGAQTHKADRRFDRLPDRIDDLDQLQQWQDIVDQLNLVAMPPEKQRQPTPAVRVEFIAQVTASIAAARQRLTGNTGHAVLRRLNAWEYRQTIGDLLSLNTEAWNPAADFPAEVRVDGFDNNGRELVTSGILLNAYFAAAEQAIHRATWFTEKPKVRSWVQKSPFYFKGGQYNDLPKLFQVDRFRFIPDPPYTDLYGRHYRGGHIGFMPLARGGVPRSGRYTIRVRAAAVDRVHPYGKTLDDFRNGDPLVLGLMAVNRVGSVESTGSVSDERLLASVELTNPEPRWLEWNVYLQRGYEPEVRFLNGTLSAKRLVRIVMKAADDHPELRPFAKMKPSSERAHGVLRAYRGPKLRVWEVQVEGPHVAVWPPAGHRLMYGERQPGQLTAEAVTHRLRVFAETAWRRPLVAEELVPIERLVASKLQQGLEPLAALQLGFQSILCAPQFLYLRDGAGPLNDHPLASRLSYFLWSSMPDATLRQLADRGQLTQPHVLRQQVERLLADPKSQRFVRHFVRRWLDLDNIGEMPPSPDFKVYYRDGLQAAMRTETEMFFRHILDNNLPLRTFVDADYTFVNRELALHYGIDNVVGRQFRRVSLAGTPRGGLLGQGAFLTASANGVDTSPVVRGIFVLDKLLGYRPPPPPDDVPQIDPDIRGATTVREQLAKHREIATCAECHRKIDPLGFALENFDAIGGWRDAYRKNASIDPSGRFPNGDAFRTVTEFRSHLLTRQAQFTSALTRKLLTYAVGRKLGIGDRPHVDAILARMQKPNAGLRDLITAIVLSESFRSN